MILAIDFDGVIHDYKNPVDGKKMGGPISGAKEALARYKLLGHKVIVFTVRGDQKYLHQWMKFYNIPYDEITNIKMNADVYIDDKAERFTGWGDKKYI